MINNNIKVYNEYTCQSALALLDFYFIKNENKDKNISIQKNIEKNLNLTLSQIISECIYLYIFSHKSSKIIRIKFII